jgi:hypothetical protein
VKASMQPKPKFNSCTLRVHTQICRHKLHSGVGHAAS